MPRLSRNLDFNPGTDATRQDIIDELGDKATDVLEELQEATQELKKSSRALELVLGGEVEVD